MLDVFFGQDQLDDELMDYIRRLHQTYKTALLSNAWDDLRQTLHQRWNIAGLFDTMIISAEVKIGKPDPRIFHLAVEHLEVQPAEAVFVDDVYENVEAARREGLQAMQYQALDQTLDELKRLLFPVKG